MIAIRVPATSANLGPGFDCLGLAVDLYLEVLAHHSEKNRFIYRGEGHLEDSADNLIHRGFQEAHTALGKTAPPIAFEVTNPIPLARGLGSSSAALVAGAALADALLDNSLGREGVFQLTARLEGHPDNVAPAVYGGFTISALTTEGSYLTQSLPLPVSWKLLFATPAFELPTQEARAVLPTRYRRSEVIFNTSRTALWSLAVARNRPELLPVASQDALHEPYRKALIPGLAECRQALLEDGAYAAFLSGAGPTLAVITDQEHLERCRHLLERYASQDGRVLELAAGEGYRLERRQSETPASRL